MFTIAKLLALTLIAGLLLAEMRTESRFVDFRAAIFVVGGTTALTLLRCELREWHAALHVTISGNASRDVNTLQLATHWYRATSTGALISGLVGGLINLIAVLYDSSAPVHNHLNGIAVSLLYPLYGILTSQFLLDPLRYSIEFRATEKRDAI